MADAQAAEEAGAFAIVLECIPRAIANDITAKVTIPTIGIGAGADCDGQVLVLHDLLGITTGYVPKFVKAYADLKTEITRAVTDYRDEVRSGKFPGEGTHVRVMRYVRPANTEHVDLANTGGPHPLAFRGTGPSPLLYS